MLAIYVVWLVLLVISASSTNKCSLAVRTGWERMNSMITLGLSEILLLLEKKVLEKSLNS